MVSVSTGWLTWFVVDHGLAVGNTSVEEEKSTVMLGSLDAVASGSVLCEPSWMRSVQVGPGCGCGVISKLRFANLANYGDFPVYFSHELQRALLKHHFVGRQERPFSQLDQFYPHYTAGLVHFFKENATTGEEIYCDNEITQESPGMRATREEV